MTNKHLAAVVLLVAGGLAVCGYLAIPEAVPGPTLANFERLRLGSSIREVEAALGAGEIVQNTNGQVRCWHCDPSDPAGEAGIIIIRFAEDRAVAGTASSGSLRHELRPPFSSLETIESLLGL